MAGWSGPGRRAGTRGGLAVASVVAAVVMGGALGGAVVRWEAAAAVPLALAIIMVGLLLFPKRPVLALAGLVAYLGVMGLLRRLSDFYLAPSSLNPLYLIGPILVAAWMANERHIIRSRVGRISAVVFWFQVALLLSTLNPLQGSPVVAFGGLVLVAVPTLLYWLAVRYLDDRTGPTLLRGVLVVAMASAVYGVLQAAQGLPPWDLRWAETSGLSSLNLADGVIRSFGTNAAASDHIGLLSIGAVVAAAAACGRDRRAISWRIGSGTLAIAFLVLIVSSGSRGSLFLTLVALILVLCARFRLPWLTLPVLVFAVGTNAIVSLISAVASIQGLGGGFSAGYERQLQGYLDPTGDTSTLPGHIERLVEGLGLAISNPAGYGIGTTTSFARFGSSYGSEVDVSNVAAGLGVIGLVLYLGVVSVVLWTAWQSARVHGDWWSLAPLGVLAATFNNWLNGGNYVVIALTWLMVGAVAVRARADGTDGGGPPTAEAPEGSAKVNEPDDHVRTMHPPHR